jgi:hypothetical protein
VYGAISGVGYDRIVAVVGDDGARTDVFGEGPLVDDLRDIIEGGVDGADPHERLLWLTRGLSYYTVVGPHDFEGVIGDTEIIARAHGL